MKEIKVNCSKSYSVFVGRNIIDNAAEKISDDLISETVVIITDDIVNGIYGERINKSFLKVSKRVLVYEFENGEKSKNITTLNDILEFLAENHVKRSDTIISLGGGVVSDLAGFAAGVYNRGIKYVSVPTTLLAAVDASVGGKTAVNLTAGKNLAGVFHQPSCVLCDCETFKTLPALEFQNGLAEALKCAVIASNSIFEKISGNSREVLCGNIENIEAIVAECVKIKADIVNADEFDNGVRRVLNLGHTIGHGIEKTSGFSVPHGYAVAVGMAIMARFSEKSGFASEKFADKLIGALKLHNLPVSLSDLNIFNNIFNGLNIKDILVSALSDKKRTGDFITLVIPEKIGKCILRKFSIEDWLALDLF